MNARIESYLYRLSKRKSRRNLTEWITVAVAEHCIDRAESVLNIGAGGEIAELLGNLALRTVSIDIDPERAPDRVASVENMKVFDNASFDAVFCMDVLEHVRSPVTALAEIARVLKPGGILIGSTPFLLGIHDAPGDYWRFTRHGLENLLGDLELLELRERNGYFSSVAVLLTRRFVIGTAKQKRLALLLSPLLVALAGTIELLDRWFHCTDATTGYFFVSRKPRHE